MWQYVLLPAEAVYRLGLSLRGVAYDTGLFRTRRLPIPVVSIGNLTLGGTGKTPMTIEIAREAKSRGFAPVVVTRGYRGTARGVCAVSDDEHLILGAAEAGDEARLMAERLPGVPVVKAPDRFRGGRFSIDRFGADLIILDDGFQHRALERDLNLLLLDPVRPLGNGRCIPAGPLREPVSAAVRADAFVAVGEDGVGETRELLEVAGGSPLFRARVRIRGYRKNPEGELFPPGELKRTRVYAFCGIARPERFRRSVEGLGARVVGWKAFRDHRRYRPEDEARIMKEARDAGADLVLTTEKDRVKINWPGVATLVMGIEPDPGLFDHIFDGIGPGAGRR